MNWDGIQRSRARVYSFEGDIVFSANNLRTNARRDVCDERRRPTRRRNSSRTPPPPGGPNCTILICLILAAVIILGICIWQRERFGALYTFGIYIWERLVQILTYLRNGWNSVLAWFGFSAPALSTQHEFRRPKTCPAKTKVGDSIVNSPPVVDQHNFNARLQRLEENYNVLSSNLKEIDQKLQKQIAPEQKAPDGNVEEIVSTAIAKFNADKTGLPDLALESSGGSIINSCRLLKYSTKKSSQITFFGIPVWSPPNTPRTIIQPGAIPGDCFSFEGEGNIVIKLIGPGFISGFTMEHIPKSISPNGKIEAAPKEFQVLGLLDYSNPETEFDFGNFTYLDNNEAIQTFPVQHKSDTLFPYIELRVKNNHGGDFTCLYRFRVHGTLTHPNSLKYQNLVNFSRTCSENCVFQPKSPKSIHLVCSEENVCKCESCGCDCPGDVYQVEESNGKCIIEQGGPCGTDNGLEISCDDKNECVDGICTGKY